MYFFFDYIYYRLTKFYFKWDGKTGGTGIVGVSMIQFVMFLNGTLLLYGTIHGTLKRQMHPLEKWLIAAIMFGLVYYNYRKYSGTYNKLRYHWKDESNVQRLGKGFLVIASLIIPWVLSIIIGIYFQNQ